MKEAARVKAERLESMGFVLGTWTCLVMHHHMGKVLPVMICILQRKKVRHREDN